MTSAKSIRTEQEYKAALARLYELFHAATGTQEGDEFEVLADLVEAYEDIHYPIPDPTPAGVVQGRLDALGLSEDDLVHIIGSREAVDKVLEGRVAVTRDMADGLSKLLGIEMESLLEEPVPREN